MNANSLPAIMKNRSVVPIVPATGHRIPCLKPNESTGWGTRGMRMIPIAGRITPLIRRNTEEVKARKNLPMTSSRCIGPHLDKSLALGRCEGKQSHAPRPFDGRREQPLVTGTIPRDSAWGHLPTLRHELGNHSDIFVVDHQSLVSAKSTNFAAEHGPPARRSLLIVPAIPHRSCARFPLCHRLHSPMLGAVVNGTNFSTAPKKNYVGLIPNEVEPLYLGIRLRRRILGRSNLFFRLSSRSRWTSGRASLLSTHGQVAQNAVGQFQISLQFFNCATCRSISQQGVDAFPLLVDSVREISKAPFIYLGNRAILPLNDVFELFDELF